MQLVDIKFCPIGPTVKGEKICNKAVEVMRKVDAMKVVQ